MIASYLIHHPTHFQINHLQYFPMEQPEQLDYQVYKQYEILEKVGKGTYGVVYRARHKKSARIVAIKKIIDAFQNLIDAKRTYRELNYLLQIDHPSIVRLEYLLHLNRKGLLNEPSTMRLAVPPFSFEERGATTDKVFWKPPQQVKHVYAVFEFIETDLACALKKCQELQPIQRKYIAYQLLHGIAYLHRSGLVHRDIKPSNILLNCSSLEVKICDFGMARLKVSNDYANEGVLTEYVASRWYRPPEALLGITTCHDSIDLWSVGCVLAELVLKTPLFPGKSTLDQLELILKCIGMPSGKEIDRLSSEDAQFLLRNFSFGKRCKIRCLQETLSSCGNLQIDLIMNLLKFQPSQRISAEQALKHEYFSDVRHMSQELDHYSNFTTKILDFSHGQLPQTQGRSMSSSQPNIDHYRMLIDQLEKYAQRSTNRSGDAFNTIPHEKQGQNIPIPHNFTKNEGHEEDKFKEKSTKQSDFVTLNKHHYLSSTHSAIHNKEIVKPQIEEKTKTVVEEGKARKIKKGKAISKADIFDKSLTHIQKSEKAIPFKKQPRRQPSEKPLKTQNKEKKALTVPKKGQSLHKNQSTKQIINRPQSPISKQPLLFTQPLPKPRPKKPQDKDSKSLVSNKSSSSFHRPSKQKPSLTKKGDALKRFQKPSLHLNKTTIVKCKPPKSMAAFKKNP